jgi:PRTRC genetic system protein E
MTTPIGSPSNGFFAQLMPMLADRTLMLIVSKADDQHLTVSVVPKRMKEGENTALTTPLCCTGTPEELDRDLPDQLREFVAGYLALSNNLAQIQREREEAEKAAREELKKKQKTVGNGGAKAKAPESEPKVDEKAPSAAPVPSTMSLFESTADPGPQVEATSQSSANSTTVDMANGNNNNNVGGER